MTDFQVFRNSFLSRVYSREIYAKRDEISSATSKVFNEQVDQLAPSELCLRYKRYSTVYPIKLVIEATGQFTIVKGEGQPLFRFYNNTPPSAESLLKTVTRVITIKGENFKFIQDAHNKRLLDEIISVVSQASEAVKVKYEELTATMLDELQVEFEINSNTKIVDMFECYQDYSAEKLLNFFTVRNFSGIPAVDKFPVIKSRVPSTAYPFNGWEFDRRPDGYGHECGSAVGIDWYAHKLYEYGFSSDD